MRLLIITQDDPFFLPRNIEYFLNKISSDDEVVAAVVLNVHCLAKRKLRKKSFENTQDLWNEVLCQLRLKICSDEVNFKKVGHLKLQK